MPYQSQGSAKGEAGESEATGAAMLASSGVSQLYARRRVAMKLTEVTAQVAEGGLGVLPNISKGGQNIGRRAGKVQQPKGSAASDPFLKSSSGQGTRLAAAPDRRWPISKITLSSRRYVIGLGHGVIQVLDGTTAERLASIHPELDENAEQDPTSIRAGDLRLLGLTFDTRSVMASFNDGRIRRWKLNSSDRDDLVLLDRD